jgi:hypothetical protein
MQWSDFSVGNGLTLRMGRMIDLPTGVVKEGATARSTGTNRGILERDSVDLRQ